MNTHRIQPIREGIVTDTITTAIATAVASQTAQTLTSQATHSLAEVAKRIKKKFRERPADLAILSSAQDDPSSPARILRLAQALHQAALDDPDFGEEIRALWTQSRTETTSATDDGIVNAFHGRADKVIQLRDIHGDLNIS
jgi:hypothetical protein